MKKVNIILRDDTERNLILLWTFINNYYYPYLAKAYCDFYLTQKQKTENLLLFFLSNSAGQFFVKQTLYEPKRIEFPVDN